MKLSFRLSLCLAILLFGLASAQAQAEPEINERVRQLETELEKQNAKLDQLQKTIEEYLYPAMEDFTLDIIIDQGPNARSVRLNLPRFTLIGATTRS